MNAVITSETDDKKSVYSHNANSEFRSSLIAPIDRGSLFGLEEYFDLGKEQKRISLKILTDLDLDKINELKHIYNICDIDQQGFIKMDKLRTRKSFFSNDPFVKYLEVNELKKMSFPAEEVIEFFEYITEEENKIITKETFNNLMNEMEKVIVLIKFKDY